MIQWISQNGWLAGLFARMVVAVVLFAVGLFVAERWWAKLGWKSLVGCFALRSVIMWIIVVVVGILPPDISCWWTQNINPIIQGERTILTLKSVYYPGFIIGSVWFSKMFHSPYGMVFFFLLAEAGALCVLFLSLTRVYGEKIARQTLIIYLTSPFGFIVSGLGAQDEPLLMLPMYAFLFFALFKQSRIGCFISILFAILFSKILVLFYMLPITLVRRYRGIFMLFGVFGLFFGCCYLCDYNVVDVSSCSLRRTLGNFWYVFQNVPDCVQVFVFLLVSAAFILCMVPNFFARQVGVKTVFRATMVLTVCLDLILNLTYRTVFSPYLLPVIPFLIALYLGSENNVKKDYRVRMLVLIWFFVMSFIDSIEHGAPRFGLCNMDDILRALSLFCIVLTSSLLVMIVMLHKDLFYSPWDSVKLLIFSTQLPRSHTKLVNCTNITVVPFDKHLTAICKGVAIMLLLWHHLFLYHSEFGQFVCWSGMSAKACIAIFLVLSGYGVTKTGLGNGLAFFYRHRIMKFLLNFWIVAIPSILLCVFILGRGFPEAYPQGWFPLFFLQVLGLDVSCSTDGFNATWWFVSAIVWLYLLFPLLQKGVKRFPIGGFLGTIVLAFLPSPLLKCLSAFVLGIILCEWGYFKRIEAIRGFWAWGTCVLSGIAVVYGFNCRLGLRLDWFIALSTCTFIYLLYRNVCPSFWVLFSPLAFLGRHSMNIFLLHSFICSYFMRDFIEVFGSPISRFAVLLSVSLLLSFVVELLKKAIGFKRLMAAVSGEAK